MHPAVTLERDDYYRDIAPQLPVYAPRCLDGVFLPFSLAVLFVCRGTVYLGRANKNYNVTIDIKKEVNYEKNTDKRHNGQMQR